MQVNVLPILSSLHDGKNINRETKKLLSEIESNSSITFSISNVEDFYNADLSLILVQTGGSEGGFLKMKKDLKPPYYLLTYGSNNSLAASMEILSYLQSEKEESEILHGSVEYITSRLLELIDAKKKQTTRLGVVGQPSDWLIASNVDYNVCKELHNIELVDIDIKELIDLYNSIELGDYKKDLVLDFDQNEVGYAKKMSKALNMIKDKYKLSGLTLRCFDLLDTVKTTGCLGLALLNSENSIGTCEGDIPSMISMYLMKQITGASGFQANPSSIDVEQNEMVLAHCTLPLNMTESYKTMTHYESGIGVAFRGKLKLTDVTVFKLSNNLKDYFVGKGRIIENLDEDNLCRTQIRIEIENSKYFLTKPYGNHHIVVYGDHKDKINQYMAKFK